MSPSLRGKFALTAILAGSLFGLLFTRGVAATAPSLYDVTGHWVGTATPAGSTSQIGIEGQFTAASNHKTFTGTFVVHANPDEDYTAKGTLSTKNKFAMKLTPQPGPNQGHPATAQGVLNTGTNTMTGTFKSKNHGTFTMTKQ